MKLFRFNSTPVEIDPTQITTIYADEGVFTVYLETGEYVTGYLLEKN